jgi:hypothetical protein
MRGKLLPLAVDALLVCLVTCVRGQSATVPSLKPIERDPAEQHRIPPAKFPEEVKHLRKHLQKLRQQDDGES